MSRIERWARLSGLGTRVAGRVLDSGMRHALSPRHIRDKARERLQAQTAQEVAATLSQLKGAAMKMGQQLALAASSLDLPEDVQRSLATLHDTAEPVPFPTIRATLEDELEAPIDTLFARIDPSPLGTASLGQAHLATLPDGREVVVKVLHDGVAEGLEADLLALKGMLASGRLFGREAAELDDIFDEVATHLRLELDYLQEAANIETFAALFGDDPRFVVPHTVPRLCTERVLTMDRVPGRSLDDFLAEADPESHQLAGERLADWFFESTFTHRVLHADPHPGNYLFCDDGRVAVLDFGCVKRFDEFFLGAYARTVLCALDGDRDGTLQACMDLGVWSGATPAAGDAIWMFCDATLAPWRDGESVIGEEDNLVTRVRPAVEALWKYPEIRGAKDMVYLHRTLAGLYTLARKLRVRGAWSQVLRTHMEHAIAVAEGRA